MSHIPDTEAAGNNRDATHAARPKLHARLVYHFRSGSSSSPSRPLTIIVYSVADK